jgi:putative MATE family efflux protein
MLTNLVVMAVPIMFSNFIQVVYNLTDTFFLGQISHGAKEAVAVTGLAFPIIFLCASFGQGLAVATTALVSRFKGSNEIEKIRHVLGQTWLLNMLFLLFLFLVYQFGVYPILNILQTPEEIVSIAAAYIQYILLGIGMMFIFFIYQSFAVAIGDSISPMVINCISVILNIVLDPLFIYGAGDLPAMGVEGAGLATFLSRVLTVLMAGTYMVRRYHNFLPKKENFIPDYRSIQKILSIAIPSSMAQTTTSLGFVVMQGLVNSFGTAVMSAHAIGTRFVNFIMMPPMGISNALAGIIGQNLGAGKPERAIKSFHISLGLSMAIMTAGSIIIYFRGDRLSSFFIQDAQVISLANEMLKINSIAVWFFGFLFMFWGVFNGSGHTKPVMIADILRLWLIRLPLAYLLSGYFLRKGFEWPIIISRILEFFAAFLADKPYTALWYPMILSNLFAVLMATWIYRQKTWLKPVKE